MHIKELVILCVVITLASSHPLKQPKVAKDEVKEENIQIEAKEDDGETTTTVPEVRTEDEAEAERQKRAEAGIMVESQEKRTEEVEPQVETEEKLNDAPEAVADERADTEEVQVDETVLRTEDEAAVATGDELVGTEERINEEPEKVMQARSDDSEVAKTEEAAVEDNARENDPVQETEEVERPDSAAQEERERQAKQSNTEDAPAAAVNNVDDETKVEPEVEAKNEEAAAAKEDAECPEGKTEDEQVQPGTAEAKTDVVATEAAITADQANKDAKTAVIHAEPTQATEDQRVAAPEATED